MSAVSAAGVNGANAAFDGHGPSVDESSRNAGSARGTRPRTTQRPNNSAAVRKGSGENTTQNRQRATKKKAANADKNHANGLYVHESDDDIPENMYKPDKDEPLEGWIHRDKLAKIESEELQAAGINLANQRTRSQRGQQEKNSEPKREEKREEKRQRVQSPVQEEEDDTEQATWDIRTPEEVAADEEASSMYANPALRKSGSKIPVMSSSPIPIPAERYERDTPIARKRTASGSMSLDSDLALGKTRSLSGSKILDEHDIASATTTSKPGSPTKIRKASTPTSPPTAAATRKVTPGQRKQSIPPSSAASPPRPSIRSGEGDRPRTATNPPEGDPPWLATMYKPDPMLPPDQQIIPTIARKQQQAQWADAGAVPSTYDREFSPLAVHNEEGLVKGRSPSPPLSNKAKADEFRSNEENTWPLKPMDSVRSNSGRPGTSGSLTGGYSTMPKVTSPTFRSSSPKIGAGPTPTIAPGRSTGIAPPSRIQEMPVEEDDKVKKGCGCCIVM